MRVLDSGMCILGVGMRVLDSGLCILGVGTRVLDSGLCILGVGTRVQGSGMWILDTGCRLIEGSLDTNRDRDAFQRRQKSNTRASIPLPSRGMLVALALLTCTRPLA
jgi:hypothetical protein